MLVSQEVHIFKKLFHLFYNCVVSMEFLHGKIRVAITWESKLQQSSATQLVMHARCVHIFIIHRSLTWTTGSLTCAQELMHAIAHVGVRTL